LNVLILCTSG